MNFESKFLVKIYGTRVVHLNVPEKNIEIKKNITTKNDNKIYYKNDNDKVIKNFIEVSS